MTATSGRLLELLSLLQARREWGGRELADRVGVSGRTLRRDIDRLRGLGYPVDARTGPAGGYRLRAGTAMPPLLLDDDEAVAIAVGLRTAAGASVSGIEETSVRALVKLEQVLPEHLRRRVNALQTATVTPVATGPLVDPECLTVLAGACRDRETVRFGYRAQDGTGSRREVEPHAVVNLGRRWYLVAFDRGRRDWRTFRVDRIGAPRPAARRFEPRALPAVDAAAFVRDRLAQAPRPYEARVIVHASADEVAGRYPWTRESVVALGPDRCEYRTGDVSLDWIALRIGMLGFDFEVLEPPELTERLAALAGRLRAATRTASRP